MLKLKSFSERYCKLNKVLCSLLVTFLVNLICLPASASFTLADNTVSSLLRIAGTTRYDTAIQISMATWPSANSVVLARGDDFPDALAGAVLAKSAKVNGPLLLTDSKQLLPEVLAEIQRLQAQHVYILGGTGAISTEVQNSLAQNNLIVHRITGQDRYETSASIASEAVANSSQAFLASGNSFADALSVSSYAAAHGIPLLLTDLNTLPTVTLQALQKLEVQSITLIGGEGVISPAVKGQLESLGFTVDRLAGADRYSTNIAVLNKLNFNTSTIYTATGENFPDALSGAILAAKGNNPIMLVPSADINPDTLAYLNARRTTGSLFTLFGGWGVINYGVEDIIRTGSVHPRISLQYMQAYSSHLSVYLNQIALLPTTATDAVDILAPNLFSLDNLTAGQTVASGSISGPWNLTDNSYAQLVTAAHGRGLKLMPLIGSAWNAEGKAAIDLTLTQDASRTALVNQLVSMIQTTGADGVVIDFEYMSDSTGPYLTQFMQALYAQLHAQNKLVIQAVPARTSATDWYTEFNYHDLAQYVDYLNIMTYDYSLSTPGAIAPISWMKLVLNFAKGQKLDMSKVLLGVPYYGRDWTKTGDTTYSRQSVGLASATSIAAKNLAILMRDTSNGDTVGIPYYTYIDKALAPHTVYYDDLASWEAKLGLLNTYGLGGIGSWSLSWLTEDNAPSLFSLLKVYLRLP